MSTQTQGLSDIFQVVHIVYGISEAESFFFFQNFLISNFRTFLNRCSTFCEKKVEDGFDFPSDKSSLNFLIVCVGWVNMKLWSFCEGWWALAWLSFPLGPVWSIGEHFLLSLAWITLSFTRIFTELFTHISRVASLNCNPFASIAEL